MQTLLDIMMQTLSVKRELMQSLLEIMMQTLSVKRDPAGNDDANPLCSSPGECTGRYGHFDNVCVDKQFGSRMWDDTIQHGVSVIRGGKVYRAGTIYISQTSSNRGGFRWAQQTDLDEHAPGTKLQNSWQLANGDFKDGDLIHLRTRDCQTNKCMQ